MVKEKVILSVFRHKALLFLFPFHFLIHLEKFSLPTIKVHARGGGTVLSVGCYNQCE